jgi:hypothetical protein
MVLMMLLTLVLMQASGISGDLTENMVWRIYQEGMADLNPYVIVLYLGQSDLSAGRDPTDVAGGIQVMFAYFVMITFVSFKPLG